ncbi:plastocyanin/azurin family copper-binding protein [Haloarcula amylovorans]|uniref:plastocyanin/azurin family copper-binding protein n=1 Tax=Haloarcula amylovorans TaxID=2562280 RepID=UPI00143199E9|nr:plastocyanin/azurin family copper-binding protein [Halomicroarcula amylolytica]
MNRRTMLRSASAGVVGLLAGCSGDGGNGSGGETSDDGWAGGTNVAMTDSLAFEPKTLTVNVGDTVTWKTVGSVAHSVTAYEEKLPDGAAYFASGEFDSESAARGSYPDGSVGADETYSHTFETAGEFPYFCIPHESGMRGTIVVE